MKGGLFENIITAIDIGTTKICVLVAHLDAHGTLEIIGIGHARSEGLRKGVVVDIQKTVSALKQAVAEAQIMAGCTIESACIGVSGSHISSFSSRGMIPLKKGIVSQLEIDAVLAAAQAVALPEGQQILHALAQSFTIDGNEPIHDPRGMFGVRLEADVHIITGSISSVHNLITCCQQIGIQTTDIILEQLASAAAVLTPDERELGIGMLDIGGGTSDLAIYTKNAIKYTQVIPVAGTQFTYDLAIGLHTPLDEAERIKKEFGTLKTDQIDDTITLTSLDQEKIQTICSADIADILYPRAYELLHLVKKILDEKQLHRSITAGWVLTGGGSLLKGLPDLAQSILCIPVRIGRPRIDNTVFSSLHTPLYATGYGLLVQAAHTKNTRAAQQSHHTMSRIAARMRSWIADFF